MTAWIETARGSLIKASIISIREAKGSTDWEVAVDAGPGPALFAPALKNKATALRIRNSLAHHVDRAEALDVSTCISFAPGDMPSVVAAPMEG
jgi:hypothetical protein